MRNNNVENGSRRGKLLHLLSQREAVPQRVVVLRALPGLGDFLCAVPALRALRHALPKAHIDLLGLASTRELAGRYSHYIDGLVVLPGFPGLPEQTPQVTALPSFLFAMQSQRYDLAIQLHGNGSITNLLTLMLGARYTAGYYQPGHLCPNGATFLPYPHDLHEIERNLALLRFLGAKADDKSYEFLLTPGDYRAFERLVQRHRLRKNQYVCIHAGASDSSRRWSLDSFAACARMLHARGLQVVLTGTAAEAEINAALARRLGEPLLDLTGETGLGALALLLRHARLLLSNDTGPSHLAAAMATPSVIVFVASDPNCWAPLDASRHIAVRAGDGTAIATTQVLTALNTLLEKRETLTSRTAPVAARQSFSLD